MRSGLLTPGMIAERGTTVEILVPDYDWEKQQRWVENTPIAAKYTGGSIQTFDNHGKPKDSRGDNND